MAKKNTDVKSFNRTGLFNFEKMLVQYEDKDGIRIYDLKKLLEEYDGLEISIGATTDFPAEPVDPEELAGE